ncbi:hypothetical protein FWK35_00014178 [Aphis craccivora]|uniref:Uncharacterized protein n=1 Tax=Aphis craccivora TaxID=307492 RepID=A0A6G0YXX8_APHCR|nr:hypothetical protein FWK35_00014178 [Aphis craccivora]
MTNDNRFLKNSQLRFFNDKKNKILNFEFISISNNNDNHYYIDFKIMFSFTGKGSAIKHKSASFIKLSSVSNRKVNLVGTLGGSKVKNFPIVSKSARKNPKKVTEKQEFVRKTSFIQNRYLGLFYCNSKNNNCKYLKFSPNIYLNFQTILIFFDVDKNFLAYD